MSNSEHDPDRTHVFRVMHNFYSDCVSDLVATSQEHFRANFILHEICYNTVGVTVCELNRECLECVAFRNVVFNSLLKLLAGKRSSSNPLIFIVGKCCGKQVAQLSIPLGR